MRIERSYTFTVGEQDDGRRVDAFLASNIEGLSRSALTGSLCEISINGKDAKKSDAVRTGDEVSLLYAADVFDKVEPQDIPLSVLYEDEHMLVIDKAQGMVVHPGAGNITGTVVNALAFRYGQDFIDSMADECDVTRPGIVHRLDKDTSGVLVIAKDARSHAELSRQFQERETEKYYYAVCDGFFPKRTGEVEGLIGRDPDSRKTFTLGKTGKTSRSSFEVVKQYRDSALVKVRIYTGRTHQIRVHMKSVGHPVVGDVLYNSHLNRFPDCTLMLHSACLRICHPVTGERMEFDAPLPQRFVEFEEKHR